MHRILRSTTLTSTGFALLLATTATAQTLPTANQVAGLDDKQCVRLLRMLAEGEDVPDSVKKAVEELSGLEGNCDTLSGLWGDIQPGTLTKEEAQFLAAALQQSGVEMTAVDITGVPNNPPAALSGEAEVTASTSETVTEDNSRSSAEDFAAEEPESGMSNMEKALLAGAGALVAGAIISENRKVVNSTPDRVVVENDSGDLQVLKDDNALLRRPGSEVQTETFNDGSSRTVVTRRDGTKIVTIRDKELRVVRRTSISPDGKETVLIDDTVASQPIDVSALPEARAETDIDVTDRDALRAALAAESNAGRAFSLAQVRDFDRVRKLAPAISVDNITFETGSAAIRPSQAEQLAVLGSAIAEAIADDPSEIFLIEGHTDAVGSAGSNLLLSDRRAESVALALTEYFDVPPENLVVQGYGESDLRVPTETAERANRRAVVRRVTPLLRTARAN